jgi:hypothetical protein
MKYCKKHKIECEIIEKSDGWYWKCPMPKCKFISKDNYSDYDQELSDKEEWSDNYEQSVNSYFERI